MTKTVIILALCALVAAGSVAVGWRKAGGPRPVYGTCDNCHEVTVVDFRINAPIHAGTNSITCAPHVERMQRMMLDDITTRSAGQFERDAAYYRAMYRMYRMTGRW